MNSVWQQITLTTLPLHQWRSPSYLHRGVGLLQAWRQQSWLMQWADAIAGLLISLVFCLVPFVSSDLTGLLLLACAGYWVLLTLTDDRTPKVDAVQRRVGFGSGFTPIHLLVLLYWGISTIAAAASPVKSAALVGWSKLTLYLIFFALMARVLRSARLRSWLITLYLHVAVLISGYGLRQWFFGAEALATWVDPESPFAKTVRVYSFLGNPNLLAGYLLPAIALGIAAIFAWRGWLPKLLAIVMTIVNIACLILTFSRGGLIGFVVITFAILLLLLFWWSIHLPRFWRIWSVPILVGSLTGVLVVAVLFVPPLRNRVFSIFAGRGDSSNNFRLNVWTSVLQMIQDYPILGIGPGDAPFKKIYPFYQRARFSALSAYSILLEVAVETGLIGLTAFLWLLLVTLTQGLVQLKRLRSLQNRDGFWLIGAIASLLGLFGQAMFDTVLYRPQVNTLWWLSIALIASFYAYHQPLSGGRESDSIE
ncbi:MAG: putative bicarbonate transporter, IctB family [Leptolyngbyaceae cyanobacterium CSU_1_3]|nr:putative bicarbonate transporter, IctB family [Leptolyngbyaceae cyanobacterium CSU_1_3]